MRSFQLAPPAALLIAVAVGAQTPTAQKKPPARSAALPATEQVQPYVVCPMVLGVGVKTGEEFCDVTIGRDPETGIIVPLPRFRGTLVLTFDLHNRVTYSEQLIREKRSYAQHTAVIGVLTMDGRLITRAAVSTEYRNADDLLDRISGGAGPSGLKAIAPVGDEKIRVEIPEQLDAVAILGEKLSSETPNGRETYTAPGRPIAVISNVMIEYRPAPPGKPPRAGNTRRSRAQTP
jgi:hypothetical protein